MLEIRKICKEYKTGELVQKALDEVSLCLRDSEFVSILGPSGSGKTTLLNIIGGLDRYDSGDLLINGVSTKEYSDRDWDTYRNHSIGFVFQSYNLIPHQSILSNVELALTIGGLSKAEGQKKAKKALEKVGLGDQLHKKPNQMSGGQMQRVAIARALVNDPDILLADEPTGALDTETSIQIMELLEEVAKDRLVVMVTHNAELAEDFSTRIVRLKDGKIVDDTNPLQPEEKGSSAALNKEARKKAHMSFGTALSLSFNNLKTKKKRTLLTSFAGSIGIIGIALILSLSNGVNTYISTLQRDTMTSYPLTISATESAKKGNKLSRMTAAISDYSQTGEGSDGTSGIDDDILYVDYSEIQPSSSDIVTARQNDLASFKKYLDDPDSEIQQYIGSNGIVYSYDVSFGVYSYDADGELVSSDADVSELSDAVVTSSAPASGQNVSSYLGTTAASGANHFEQLMPGADGAAVSNIVTESYDLLCGVWPAAYDEAVLVLDSGNGLSAQTMYQLGFMTAAEYTEAADKIEAGESTPEKTYEVDGFLGHSFYVLPACDQYVENENGLFSHKSVLDPEADIIDNAVEMKIVGVIRPAADTENASIRSAVAYTSLLTDYVIAHTNESAVILAQQASPDVNVLNGRLFNATDEEKAAAATDYLSGLDVPKKAEWYGTIMAALEQKAEAEGAAETENANDTENASDEEKAAALDEWLANEAEQELLVKFNDYMLPGGSYNENMTSFGMASFDTPSSISIYVDSFEDKEAIAMCIENYNASVDSSTQITYTDYVSEMTSSITSMIDMIALVLVAFVAVSLIVSCIMISIITHISVIERTKEIGILRALGASKRNISQVFNAETFIIGMCAGLLGVLIAVLLTIPINSILASVLGVASLKAALPVIYAVVLVAVSMVITMIGGLVPAKKAAKMDPVAALRSE